MHLAPDENMPMQLGPLFTSFSHGRCIASSLKSVCVCVLYFILFSHLWHDAVLLCLNRCRLSASPATGLVGMRENTFISDFFGCIGFLPLATQR